MVEWIFKFSKLGILGVGIFENLVFCFNWKINYHNSLDKRFSEKILVV